MLPVPHSQMKSSEYKPASSYDRMVLRHLYQILFNEGMPYTYQSEVTSS